MSKKVTIELCQSNSVGSRYNEPTVKELRRVSQEEAHELLSQKLPNGYFWRRQDDRTGN